MFLLSIFYFFACGRDPILDRVDEMTASSKASTSPSKDPKKPFKANTTGADSPQPSPPDQGREIKNEGPKIKISGVVVSNDCPDGPIRLNVSNGIHSEKAGVNVKVLGELRNIKPGNFSIQISPTTDKLYIDAFCDANKNGRPEDNEPKAIYKSPLNGNSDHSEIEIELLSSSGNE